MRPNTNFSQSSPPPIFILSNSAHHRIAVRGKHLRVYKLAIKRAVAHLEAFNERLRHQNAHPVFLPNISDGILTNVTHQPSQTRLHARLKVLHSCLLLATVQQHRL